MTKKPGQKRKPRANISKSKKCFNVKSSTYFHIMENQVNFLVYGQDGKIIIIIKKKRSGGRQNKNNII